MKTSYESLVKSCQDVNIPIPENNTLDGKDTLIRNLDCAVLETLHAFRAENDEKEFDSECKVLLNPYFGRPSSNDVGGRQLSPKSLPDIEVLSRSARTLKNYSFFQFLINASGVIMGIS